MTSRSATIRGLVVLAGALLAIACGVSNDALECRAAGQCPLHAGGSCAASPSGRMWCTYADPECKSSARWSEQAGDGLAGLCLISQSQGPEPDGPAPDARRPDARIG